MDEVFLKAPEKKREIDEKAYQFLVGFVKGCKCKSPVDYELMYNNIDGMGNMIYGPIQNLM